MVKIDDKSRAVLRTSLGNMTLSFIADKAPRTAENFAKLAKKGFYDGLTFHRVLKDFMVQGGCPKGTGSGGPGYTIRPEFNDTPHVKGVVSMARSNDPHSAGSQFFIVHGESRYLDSKYTAFAKLVDGEDVLDKIADVSTNMEMRFNEKSVPRDPIYINGIDLEGVEFDDDDLDEGGSRNAPREDKSEKDEKDEKDDDAKSDDDGEEKPKSRSRRGGGRSKKADEGKAKSEGKAEAASDDSGEAPKPAAKKATRKKATRTKAAGKSGGSRKKSDKNED